MTMKRALFLLLALCSSSLSQTTNITVVADANRAIRTNFSLVRFQVSDLSGASFAISNITGLQTALDAKLATNGSILDLSGVLPVVSGGTGATNSSLAISNLLPTYTGNSNRVLGLNSNETSLEWISNAVGAITNIDLSSTNVTGTLATSRGGTGVTNIAGSASAIFNSRSGIVIGIGATVASAPSIVIGSAASAGNVSTTDAAVSIGESASASQMGVAIGDTSSASSGSSVGFRATNTGQGGAVGYIARTDNGGAIGGNSISVNGGAIGFNAVSSNSSFAGGHNAVASGGTNVQLLVGTNTNAYSIQLLSAGAVDTNEWAALANASTIGTNVLRNTNATWLTNTTASGFRSDIAALATNGSAAGLTDFPGITTNISVVGTNNTNVLVFTNGLLMQVQ